MNNHEKIQKALFEYIKNRDFRDRFYHALVYEKEPFNCYSLYNFELVDSLELEYKDLIIVYAMDYNEGQEIDVLMIFSDDDIRYNVLRYYKGEFIDE